MAKRLGAKLKQYCSMKRYIYLLITTLIIGCSTNSIDLPKTKYFQRLPKQGLNRNVILNLEGNDLYCNEILISDLACIWNGTCNCVKLNEGSNKFTIALAIDKKTNFKIIDSVLYKLAQNSLATAYLLTNDISDSVGIKISNSWFFEIHPPPPMDSNSYKLYMHRLTFDNKFIYCDSNKIDLSEIDSFWKEFIGTEHFVYICPKPNDSYAQIVWILESYLLEFNKVRNSYSIGKFGNEYEDLMENEKYEIDKKFIKSILVKHIKK